MERMGLKLETEAYVDENLSPLSQTGLYPIILAMFPTAQMMLYRIK